MVSGIPIIGTLCQWWSNYTERQELSAVRTAFKRLMTHSPEAAVNRQVQRTVELLERCKNNSSLKRETAKLEITYFKFLNQMKIPLPAAYLAMENCELKEKFTNLGISADFLQSHPEFLSVAKKRFWKHYFPFVKIPIQMVGNELYLPFETQENSRVYAWKCWSDIQKLDLDNFRITYQGFAIGHADHFDHLAPLKLVNSDGKYALQFVTACPVGRRLPSSIDFKSSGHSFTQLILPKEGSSEAEVYSVGFYPRKISDFGMQFFKTVPGVYRNHDSNVSRIQAKQVIPIVKQYVLKEDASNSPCLLSLVNNMTAICDALKSKGVEFAPITLEQIDKAMFERNEPELDRILISLTEVRKQIIEGKLSVPIKLMERKEKALAMMRRFEKSKEYPYHMLSFNCTAASYQQEAFAVAFLDAKLDRDAAVQVYETQRDIQNHQFGILDRIRDVFERIFLHFFAALPLTGLLLGIGSTHPDAKRLSPNDLIPSVLSKTAFAIHQTLTAPFVTRSLFPAGEILAKNTPIVEPPGFFSRLRYLFSRGSLLNPEFNLFERH
jgi:hypothetical protein